MNFFKNILVKTIFKRELAATQQRLQEATEAIKDIEQKVVSLAPGAPAELHKLGEDILTRILSSAHEVQSAAVTTDLPWAKALYAKYHSLEKAANSTFLASKQWAAKLYVESMPVIASIKVHFEAFVGDVAKDSKKLFDQAQKKFLAENK